MNNKFNLKIMAMRLVMLSCIMLATINTFLNGKTPLSSIAQAVMMVSGICLIITHPQFQFKNDRSLLRGAALALIGGIVIQYSFMAGLGVYLLAYTAYLVYFKQKTAWFISKPFLLFNLVIGSAVLFAILAKTTNITLIIAISLFIVTLITMSSQAMSKAITINSGHYYLVAFGAWLIFLHDGLIGLNTFATKIPGSNWIVILLYGSGQYLITCYAAEKVYFKDIK